jgi:hypothetical protein
MLTHVEAFFAREVAEFRDRMAAIEATVDPSRPVAKDAVYLQLTEALGHIEAACRRLESTIGVNPELVTDTQQRFYAATADIFEQSWIGARARSKPRGYPGDYLLLNTIYDGQPKSQGLGGYLDLCLLDWVLGRAVCTRWQSIRQFLSDELARRGRDISILNVACGPCREYVAGINDSGAANVRITCLDNDPEALDFVRSHVAPSARGLSEIRCARYNALRMKSAAATIRNFGRSDIIYSIGLCDYVDDPHMIAMLAGWRESLAPGGVLFVAFKDSRRYDKTPYQWLLDWHFFQRTEEDCLRLFEQAGFDMTNMEMTRDASGVIINFISRVPAATVVRLDVAGTVGAPHAWSGELQSAGDLDLAASGESMDAP